MKRLTSTIIVSLLMLGSFLLNGNTAQAQFSGRRTYAAPPQTQPAPRRPAASFGNYSHYYPGLDPSRRIDIHDYYWDAGSGNYWNYGYSSTPWRYSTWDGSWSYPLDDGRITYRTYPNGRQRTYPTWQDRYKPYRYQRGYR